MRCNLAQGKSLKKDVFKYSYFPRTIKDWNNLLHDIVLANSLKEFKVKLDSYFLSFIIIIIVLLLQFTYCN